MELINHVAAIHLFKDLPDEHLNQLAMILTKMINSGLIRTEGPRGIQILDRNGLEDLARSETRLH